VKVLHVYQVYFPDDFTGIPRVIWELCEGMATLGVQSEVLCLSDSTSENAMQVGNHLVHSASCDLTLASARLSIDVFYKFKELVNKFDIIHYHYPWPVGDALHFLFGRQKPSLVTYHSDIVKQKFLRHLYAPLEASFLKNVDCIIATSPNYKSSSKNLQKFNAKVSAIPIGLPARTAPSQEGLKNWESLLGKGFFLFIGALRYYKGLTILIDAARETGLLVVIAGPGRIEEENLPDNVRYVGEVSDEDKECLLSLSRAFVLPSHLRSEAFGVALLEAARAGKPMISCEIGTGTTFINVHNKTGYVVKPNNIAELANVMLILSRSDEIIETFGKNAFNRYQNLFTAKHMCQQYLKKYHELKKITLS
jgi:glycosyltransferase involved in cell wall biosynthesis